MSNQETPTSPPEDDGTSQPPRTNLDPAVPPNSNHYLDCPGCLAEAEAVTEQYTPLPPGACACPACCGGAVFPPFPFGCEDPNCSDCIIARPPIPLACACGDPNCLVANGPLPLPGCPCPQCIGAMPHIGTGVEGAPETIAEMDRILADSVSERARLDRLMDDLNIGREPRLTDKSQWFARRMTGLNNYPPWDPRSWIMQGGRPRITMSAGENGARSSGEKDMDSMLVKNDEARGAMGGGMCPCGDPTCPGGAQGEAITQQSIANASRFEEMVATRGLPWGMLPPGLYPPPIGEVRRPTTLWPGLMFAPTSVPTVPMPPSGLPRPNNMWPGRMFAPPAVPMVPMPPRAMPAQNNMWPRGLFAPPTPMVMYNPDSNTSAPNTMWSDSMFAPRSGTVPRQPERDMQRGDEAMKRQAEEAKLAHQRSFGRMEYLWGELTEEEQKIAALKAENGRMVKGDLTTEETMNKLGKNVFEELDAKKRLMSIKQKLEKARKELVGKEVECEMAGNENSSCERWQEAGRKREVKDSEGKGKGKEVATDDTCRHFEAEPLADAARDLPKKASPPPVESEEDQICVNCGGVREDVRDEKRASGESLSVV